MASDLRAVVAAPRIGVAARELAYPPLVECNPSRPYLSDKGEPTAGYARDRHARIQVSVE